VYEIYAFVLRGGVIGKLAAPLSLFSSMQLSHRQKKLVTHLFLNNQRIGNK